MNADTVAAAVVDLMGARSDVRDLWQNTAARRRLAGGLIALRAKAGLSVAALAEQSGLARNQVIALEAATAPTPLPAEIAAYLAACYFPSGQVSPPSVHGKARPVSASGLSAQAERARTAEPIVPARLDVEAFVTLQKANVEALVAVQKLLFDLVQTVAQEQVEYVKESMAKTEAMFKGFDAKKQPAVYADELKAAVEKAMADVKETVDLGIKAQSEVVDLFVKRATANFEDIKAKAG